jgi:hypothetical protein
LDFLRRQGKVFAFVPCPWFDNPAAFVGEGESFHHANGGFFLLQSASDSPFLQLGPHFGDSFGSGLGVIL